MTSVIVMNERTAEEVRRLYDGDLPAGFAIDETIPDGMVLDTRLLYAKPARACRNCGLPVAPAAGRRPGDSPAGWTHNPSSVVLGWQGVRCPGRITGAQPMEIPEGLGGRVTA